MPNVSCIVPLYNAAGTIERCLRAIEASTYRDFEVIVVNDASTDDSAALARSRGAIVLDNAANIGPSKSRMVGSATARGNIHVFIDSDILIAPNSLGAIVEFFRANPRYEAVTGLLACSEIEGGFSTDYKNLYMNYNFGRLPSDVTFIYGSIFALIRVDHGERHAVGGLAYAEDTALGQNLFVRGRRIFLLKELEVRHLKQYSLGSLLANDFWVPHDWAMIFLRNRGWRQLGRNGTGFAHASKLQLTSIILAALLLASSIASFLFSRHVLVYLLLLAAFGWICANIDFFRFLFRRRGPVLMLKAAAFTLLDQLIMVAGIAWGCLKFCSRRRPGRRRRTDAR